MGDENAPPGRLSATGNLPKVSDLCGYEADIECCVVNAPTQLPVT